ncbi:unnamed protein product [Mortierella alpina]
MSHSRANNDSADLEHLELTEELIAPVDHRSEPSSVSVAVDPKRVSINSVESNSSNSTVKYHPHHQASAQPSIDSASSSYGRPAPSLRLPSTSSISSSTAAGSRRGPKSSSSSYRHSLAGPPPSSSNSNSANRRRHQQQRSSQAALPGRPGSTRSSVRHRNRSDIEEEDESADQADSDDRLTERPNYSNVRRASSRRSVRLNTEDDYDVRSFEGNDHNFAGQSGDDNDDDGSEVEPLTLKDRQEVVLGLSYYLLWPFGQYVERELAPGEVKAEGFRSSIVSELDSHGQEYNFGSSNGNGYGNGYSNGRLSQLSPLDESRPLLPRSSSAMYRERSRPHSSLASTVKRLPRTLNQLGLGGIVYYIFYYTLIGPLHLFVSCLCWFMVVSIPMGKLTYVLATHLHRNPLRLNFKRGSSVAIAAQQSEILLCVYDAIGLQYYKYTYDGTNIIFINLMPVVFFTILDDYVLTKVLGHHSMLTTPAVIFSLGLASVIPLSYFIGMAVSSISAQSSLGMGAVINATFGSIIEIILYSVALTQGKGLITEGALIGSFLAGLLLMPGLSMMSGAIKKKEQKFNAKSAGVTATMLIMSLIGVLTPTLFYNIHGRFELRCTPCPEAELLQNRATCERCYHYQPNPTNDAFFHKHVKPLMYFCCIILPSAYLIGIWFSLRTHVKQIWHEPQPRSVRDSSIYKKLLPMHILQQLLHYGTGGGPHPANNGARSHSGGTEDAAEMGRFTSHAQDSGESTSNYQSTANHGGLNERRAPHSALATAHSDGMENSSGPGTGSPLHPAAHGLLHSLNVEPDALKSDHGDDEDDDDEAHGGHDSPNWSKAKSATVLLGCTVLYSIIAEILVDSVDAVSSIDEKLLGLTLFALVPNVTEFMNAISFAMYGNIALSMEIGSAYALQVCLIQIPAMVAVSAWLGHGTTLAWNFSFNLIFQRWDVFTMLFSVFLLTYTYIEGKSNYFKGSILILSYCVLMAGFVYAPSTPGDGEVGFMDII